RRAARPAVRKWLLRILYAWFSFVPGRSRPCRRIRSPSPGLTRDPPRQRTPLLPVLLGARARQIEHRQAVARAMHVYLRRAQMRDQRKLECVEKLVQLARAVGPGVDAHRHQPDGDFT